MNIPGKVATWLGTIAAAHFQHHPVAARLHPIAAKARESCRPEQQCYAISIDGRWLCSGTGQLTLFKGLASAKRFLTLLRVSNYEAGETAAFSPDCTTRAHCMAYDRRRGLRDCSGSIAGHTG